MALLFQVNFFLLTSEQCQVAFRPRSSVASSWASLVVWPDPKDQMLADGVDAEAGPAVSLFSGKRELGAVSDRSYKKLNRTNKSSESLSLESHFSKLCLCA